MTVLKYRWILLLAVVMWIPLAIAIELGTAKRAGITFVYSFILPAMLLTALAPASVPKMVSHKYFGLIFATWSCAAVFAVYAMFVWLTGVGYEAAGVIFVYGAILFCGSNIIARSAFSSLRHASKKEQADEKNPSDISSRSQNDRYRAT